MTVAENQEYRVRIVRDGVAERMVFETRQEAEDFSEAHRNKDFKTKRSWWGKALLWIIDHTILWGK